MTGVTMVDVAVPSAPALSTMPGVELVHTGDWQISTGPVTFTTEDLAEAVGALDCPAIRRPVLKLGHTDPRFDGEPAVGWVANMATTDNGRTLVGDYVGMPGWLGGVLASAYPDRSVEGWRGFRCQLGHVHPFVIDAVALLGVTRPGVGTLASLQDVADLYGVAASADGTGERITVTIRAAAAAPHTGAMIALIPSEADVQRLAVDGGEPAGDLHTTLMYLGKAADYTAEQQASIIAAVTDLAAGLGAFDAEAFAVCAFNPGAETAITLGVGGAGVEAVHQQTTDTITGLDLPAVPDQHAPWNAHITLIYSDDLTQVAALADRTGPLVYDRLRVAFAGDATDIPLVGPVPAHARSAPMPEAQPIAAAAAVTTEDIRRQWYEQRGYGWWICEMQQAPMLQLVVTDDDGGYQRVPVTITGDVITFETPVDVEVVYVDTAADSTTAVAAAASPGPDRWRTRDESTADVAPVAASAEDTIPAADAAPQIPAAEPVPTHQEDDMSLSTEVRQRLGLAVDADEAAVLAALDAVVDQATAPEPAPVAAAALPPGVTTIDEATLAELKRNAEAGAAAHSRQVVEDRDRHIAAARDAGKIPPARVEHWTSLWDADPDGTRTTLDGLAEGLVVPVAAKGYSGGEPTGDAEAAEFDHLFSRPAATTKGV